MRSLEALAARRAIERFESASVLIVGDVMLDQFVVGRVNRISPEAPVPVVEFDHDEYRLGGAANVALNVSALGGKVALVGLLGQDAPAERLTLELKQAGIASDHLYREATRRTTTKVRIVTTRHQQVARVDYETDAELPPEIEGRVADRLERAARGATAILVSDYLKGVVTATLMRRLVGLAQARDIPLLVDPKIPHIDLYAGATIVTPNHYEAEVATHRRIRTASDARVAARIFRQRTGCSSVLITRGEHGMWLLHGTAAHNPQDAGVGIESEDDIPAAAREVADVTGAGDTVIGTLALALGSGASLLEAAQLANYAAGVAVGKFGPVAVTAGELMAAVEAGNVGVPGM